MYINLYGLDLVVIIFFLVDKFLSSSKPILNKYIISGLNDLYGHSLVIYSYVYPISSQYTETLCLVRKKNIIVKTA